MDLTETRLVLLLRTASPQTSSTSATPRRCPLLLSKRPRPLFPRVNRLTRLSNRSPLRRLLSCTPRTPTHRPWTETPAPLAMSRAPPSPPSTPSPSPPTPTPPPQTLSQTLLPLSPWTQTLPRSQSLTRSSPLLSAPAQPQNAASLTTGKKHSPSHQNSHSDPPHPPSSPHHVLLQDLPHPAHRLSPPHSHLHPAFAPPPAHSPSPQTPTPCAAPHPLPRPPALQTAHPSHQAPPTPILLTPTQIPSQGISGAPPPSHPPHGNATRLFS